MEWATLPLKKYAEFTGRSRRKEYWLFVLLTLGIYIVAGIVDSIVGLAGTPWQVKFRAQSDDGFLSRPLVRRDCRKYLSLLDS